MEKLQIFKVCYNGKPVACGTNAECWKFLINAHGGHTKVADLAERGISIEVAERN